MTPPQCTVSVATNAAYEGISKGHGMYGPVSE